MKALTIWQPWASLIIAGVKPYEFRGWRAPYSMTQRRIAIHAGARAVRRDEIADLIQRLRSPEAWTTGLRPGALPLLEEWHVDPGLLWHGVILGTAFLGAPRRSGEVAVAFGGPAADDSDRDRHANWAWPLDQVEPLDPPVPARGAQGFWEWLW